MVSTTPKTFLMEKRLVAKVSLPGNGLSNQLFAIVNSVFNAQRKGATTIAVGPMRTDYGPSGTPIPTGSVIDLEHLNAYLTAAFGITMLDADEEEYAIAQTTAGWIHAFDPVRFEAILQHLRFRKREGDAAWSPPDGPCNVVHLRMEQDALQHWGSINHMHAKDFEAALAAKYIGLVNKYLDPSVPVLIVTDADLAANPVAQHMRRTGYTLWTVQDKASVQGRELRAVQDCAAAIASKGDTLIGAFNLGGLNGSTFSYVLWHLGPCKRAVMLDPDHLDSPEQVTTK